MERVGGWGNKGAECRDTKPRCVHVSGPPLINEVKQRYIVPRDKFTLSCTDVARELILHFDSGHHASIIDDPFRHQATCRPA